MAVYVFTHIAIFSAFVSKNALWRYTGKELVTADFEVGISVFSSEAEVKVSIFTGHYIAIHSDSRRLL